MNIMNIQLIKTNYIYKYPYIDFKDNEEVDGYIYDLNGKQYFVDDDEIYFKQIDS